MKIFTHARTRAIFLLNEDRRTRELALDFLGNGAYEAKIWQDGVDISSLDVATRRVESISHLQLKLAPTGGGVAVFRAVAH